jgi:branched-chain amino acid transport system ATP-binding protein
MSVAILELEKVSAGYEKVPTIRGISLTMFPGDAVAIIGANGAGKTTLLRAIMGQIRIMEGSVSFQGSAISNLSTHRRARLGIGYAPEGRQLFQSMTVTENLEIGAARVASTIRRQRIERVLEIFPKLRPLAKSYCQFLSGGEQQMVTIARALMGEPQLLLLDEPSTGLAPRVIGELYASLTKLLSTGLSILVAEQNARAALRFAKRALVLEDGRLAMEGASTDLLGDRRVVDAYIGLGSKDLAWKTEAVSADELSHRR